MEFQKFIIVSEYSTEKIKDIKKNIFVFEQQQSKWISHTITESFENGPREIKKNTLNPIVFVFFVPFVFSLLLEVTIDFLFLSCLVRVTFAFIRRTHYFSHVFHFKCFWSARADHYISLGYCGYGN